MEGELPQKAECVQVVVRCRPMSENELNDQRDCVVKVNQKRAEIIIRNPKSQGASENRSFTYDAAYGPESAQEEVFSQSAYPICESVLEGYNGTIFAYGQTGTGKTHTMEGPSYDSHEERGIIPRAFESIFYGTEKNPTRQYLVRASFLEIYNEEIRDLLSKNPKNKLELKENPEQGVWVKDLASFVVKDIDELNQIMISGRKLRATGETAMNDRSSRSHSIFTIILEQSETGADGAQHYRMGKLNLVDLAGSERQSKTGSTGERLREATKINLSLSTLGNVISALVDGRISHIPYRDSKLTRLLQDSLGGNTKTVMIANIGPADFNYDESLSTLRYASRAKNIQNKPKINEDPKDAMLRQFQEEIENLRAQLEMQGGEEGDLGEGTGETRVVEKKRVIKVENEMKIKEMEEKIKQEKEMIKFQADLERQKIEAQVQISAEEKTQLLKQIKESEKEALKQQEKQNKLTKKLKLLENKLIQGNQMIEAAVRQEQELLEKEQKMQKRQDKERRLAAEIAKQEEEQLMMERKHKNLQEELEDKQKKVKKLQEKFGRADTELKDLQEEYGRDREDMVDTIRELNSQVKLKNKMIEYFIPMEELQRIEALAQWSDEIDDWVLPRLDLSGNALRRVKRTDVRARKKEDEENQNVLEQLPSPYFLYTEEGPMREETYQQAMGKKATKRAQTAGKRPTTAARQKQKDIEQQAKWMLEQQHAFQNAEKTSAQQNFPKARGLVKQNS